ncbi:MAG: hypothetical protein IPP47_27855 [Bryobacterales bacterium]|nr:hypothetical protein [Bryobacterales bacterium]
MFNINPIQIAMTAVGGPLGGVLGSIMGQLTGGGNPAELLGSVMKAFEGIFKSGGNGAKGGQLAQPFPAQPLPFSSGPGGVTITIQSPLNALQQGQAAPTDMQQISKLLGDLLSKLQGVAGGGAASAAVGAAGLSAGSAVGSAVGSAASASSGGGSAAPASTGNSGGWGNIDSMMSQAESLMNSDKPSDQLKAQQLMQKAQRMFEMISKMMEQRSQMMSKAIQAIK